MSQNPFRVAVPALLLCLAVSPCVVAQYNRYGLHEVAAPIPVPACSVAARVACFVDSTREYSDECCASTSTSRWLVFAAFGDSLEFFGLSATSRTYLTLYQPGRRSWQEHLPGLTAPFLRLRVPETTGYVLTVDLDPLDSAVGLRYELRVRSVAPTPLPTDAPLVRILGNRNTRIQVRPLPAKPALASRAVRVPTGTYRVYAPDVDSLEVCRLPCRTPRTIPLRVDQLQTIRP